MKKKIRFSLLMSIFCLFSGNLLFSQQTYKVTEGELQFINPEKGIFIKKDNLIYKLNLENILDYEFDNENINKIYKFELEKISDSEFEEYSNSKKVINASAVTKLNLSKIQNIKFVDTTSYDIEQFYYYNKNMFVFRKVEKRYKQKDSKELYPFVILNFKNNKQIIYFNDGLIIPTTNNLKIHLQNKLNNYQIEKIGKLTANEISLGHFTGIDRYYEIDTIKSKKKVFLKNMYFKNVLKKTYDSIYTNRNFIVGYGKKKIDVYNYQFQKLPLKKIKAIYLEKYFAKAQIISKNSLININLLGKEYKKGDGPGSIDLSFQFPDEDIRFMIFKENNNYFFRGDSYRLINNGSINDREKTKLFNTEAIDSLEFADNYFNSITLYTESGYSKKYPTLIYSILKNKKFNLNTFDYFLLENLNSEQKKINDELPKNLDFLEKIDNDNYLIKKDGLYSYYPIIKEIKYKTIDKFQGNFARFELPNGKKGWLSKNGKEYLDE